MQARTLSLALVALVALAPMAAADEGSSGPREPPRPPPCQPEAPCNDPGARDCMAQAQTEAERRACVDDYCARHQNDWCARYCQQEKACAGSGRPQPPPGPGPGKPQPQEPQGVQPCLRDAGGDEARREACRADYCRGNPRDCESFCRDHARAAFCGLKPRGDERHITFEPAAQGFSNLTVRGRLVLESVRMDAAGAFETESHGRTLRIEAGESRLELHDDASGFLRFEGDNATVTLTFPAGVTHDAARPGAKVHYPDGGLAILEGRHATWVDDRTVVATDFFSFHVAGPARDGNDGSELRRKVKGALEQGDRIGAEVRLNRGPSEVLAYDRVDVRLRPPQGSPTLEDPITVTVSADLEAGRTIVLRVNRSLLDAEPDALRLRYFDLPEGENGTARTEVLFRPALSLDDILDATDDEGQPEYYVVRDQDGLQVMVTVPHWSVHQIEISGLAEVLQPSVLVGLAAGAAGVAIAAVALFVPRRRDES